jgi:hypothetical protein
VLEALRSVTAQDMRGYFRCERTACGAAAPRLANQPAEVPGSNSLPLLRASLLLHRRNCGWPCGTADGQAAAVAAEQAETEAAAAAATIAVMAAAVSHMRR